jgi:hypothetical protein
MMGLRNRYNLISSNGQVLDRWETGLSVGGARTIGYGGAGTSIAVSAASFTLNGVSTRLTSINQNTREITSFSGDVVQQTGRSIGGWMTLAYGADDLLYLFDHENLRILKFDTGVRGGTRGAFLGAFDLDPTKPAINSMTVDAAAMSMSAATTAAFISTAATGNGSRALSEYINRSEFRCAYPRRDLQALYELSTPAV